jgi:hypothetical protein
MVTVVNMTDRIETLSAVGHNMVRFAPGATEITEDEFKALSAPEGKEPSVFSWFLKNRKFIIESPEDIKPPDPEPKAVVKAKKKVAEAERLLIREEINSLLKVGNHKKRSMKYANLAEDFCVELDEFKDIVKVREGKEEEARLFIEWLKSEFAKEDEAA